MAMLQRKANSWGVPIQYVEPSGASCHVMHAKSSLIVLIARIAWSIRFGNANMGTLYNNRLSALYTKIICIWVTDMVAKR